MCEINKKNTVDFFIWIENFFEKRRLKKEKIREEKQKEAERATLTTK